MRMLIKVKFPHDTFNRVAQKGNMGETLHGILEELKPEAVYFTEYEGQRGLVMVADLEHSSQVPKYAEPWFLLFDADVEFHVAMTPADLQESGLDALVKKWA